MLGFSIGRIGAALVVLLAMAPQTVSPTRADDAERLRALTAAYNASGHDLFVKFAASPGNIVFSPYSIGTAMAMALSGARGETANEMATVLRQTLPRDEIDAANMDALAVLNGYDRDAAPSPCPAPMLLLGWSCDASLPADGVCPAGVKLGQRCVAWPQVPIATRLKIANALMLPKPNGALISADYAGLLKDKYQAEVFRDADLATVNGWVSRRTEGKIPRMLDVIDPRDVAIIVNAVYFKAGWRMPFVDTRRSDDGDNFNLTPTEKVKVTMMRGKGLYATVDRPGYRAIRLPYTVDALAMAVVLPDEIDGAGRIAGELDAAALAGLLKDLNDPKEVEVSLPRFKTSFEVDLKLLFARAGMVRAFDFGRADFSGMTGTVRAGLAITEIKHRADIEVTEYGTEAAASTYVRIQGSYHAPLVAPFVVDRPFLFYITDDATGAILFAGRISDPRPPRS